LHEILKYLKEHGERLDSEIAKDTGISLAKVRISVSNLITSGEVIMCHLIRFEKGKKSEGMLYRVAGYIPPVGPGRKPKAQT
jgi:transcription initiation factor IIE alpha subunit